MPRLISQSVDSVTGIVSGLFGCTCALMSMISIARLLASDPKSVARHPRATGTAGFFVLLGLENAGDALLGVFIILDFFVQHDDASSSTHAANATVTSSSASPLSPTVDVCAVQGFVNQLGCCLNVCMTAVMAVEIWALTTNKPKPPSDQTARWFWGERASWLAAVGVLLVVLQLVLAGVLYGYGSDVPLGHAGGFCWIQVINPVSIHVAFYAMLYVVMIVVIVFFTLVACKIRRSLASTSEAFKTGDERREARKVRRRVWRTAAKMFAYPLAFCIAWLPAVLHRFLDTARLVASGGTASLWLSFVENFLTLGMGWINFILLCIMNTQLREQVPGIRCCRRLLGPSCCCGSEAVKLRHRRPSWTPNPTVRRDPAVELEIAETESDTT